LQQHATATFDRVEFAGERVMSQKRADTTMASIVAVLAVVCAFAVLYLPLLID
jgi:hypothetical protein